MHQAKNYLLNGKLLFDLCRKLGKLDQNRPVLIANTSIQSYKQQFYQTASTNHSQNVQLKKNVHVNVPERPEKHKKCVKICKIRLKDFFLQFCIQKSEFCTGSGKFCADVRLCVCRF